MVEVVTQDATPRWMPSPATMALRAFVRGGKPTIRSLPGTVVVPRASFWAPTGPARPTPTHSASETTHGVKA